LDKFGIKGEGVKNKKMGYSHTGSQCKGIIETTVLNQIGYRQFCC